MEFRYLQLRPSWYKMSPIAIRPQSGQGWVTFWRGMGDILDHNGRTCENLTPVRDIGIILFSGC